MRNTTQAWLLAFLFVLTSLATFAQKDTNKRSYPKLIKEDGKTGRGAGKSIFNKHFDITTDDELVDEKSETDQIGFTHDKFQQYYKKVKVEGGTYTIHSKKGMIESLSGEFKSIKGLDVNPSISEPQAFDAAVRYVGAKIYAWDPSVSAGYPGYQKPKGELVIIGGGDDDQVGLTLAWKFDIYAADPLYRAYVYVDAKTGKVAFENHRIHYTNFPTSGTSLYNGSVSFTADKTGTGYRLRQTTLGKGIETYSLKNGTSYTNPADVISSSEIFTIDPTAVQAHWGAEQTYQFFQKKYGRNSFDNLGSKIMSYVHYGVNYVNAFWDGTRMTYGDGNLSKGYEPLVSLDIVGHEITHGVTQYAANLTYSYESGALNESFSDIFGEAIEYYAKGSNDWLMGCDIGTNNNCGAFRSMADPNYYGDPDTYKGLYWDNSTSDNGGVHTNSGVQNKWFYILVNGETGVNDLGNSYAVTGIGMDKAAEIAYRSLTVYLNTSSTYANAREAAIQSAIDRYGANSPEVTATTDAWYAVGVGCNYSNTSCSPVNYCNSKGTSQADEWISNITIGTFSNTSAASPYTYFSEKTVSLVAGSINSISLTPGFTSKTYPEYWRIWIDYNKDKDFDDAGELVYDAGSTSSTVKTGTMVISATATGTTRMRVSMKYGSAPTPCEMFSYGEVEDYPVTFTTLSPAECVAATGLKSTSTLGTSTTLSWNAVTGASGYKVEYKNANTSTWIVASSNNASTSISLSNLTAFTTYDWRITTLCSGSPGSVVQAQFRTADSYEANNTASASKTISVNTDILAAISTSSDTDWFNFTISKTATAKNLKIVLSNMPLDYDVNLYNSATSSTPIGTKSISGEGAARTVTILFPNNATSNVTYYLKVNGIAGLFSDLYAYTVRANTSSTPFAALSSGITSSVSPISIMEEKTDPELSLYPVPAQDRISIRYKAEEKGNLYIQIYDIGGKQVISSVRSVEKGINQLSVGLGNTPSGTYILQTTQKNKTYRKQLEVKR